MATYTYKKIIQKAKEIKNGVEKDYKLVASTPVYYIAKAVLNHKNDVNEIKIDLAKGNTGDYISNQIYQTDYLDMMRRLVKYVEANGHLPSNILWKTKKVKVSDYVYAFARILVYYDKNGILPKYVNVNSKAYTKPTETSNAVYDYFVKKTGKKYKYLDDFIDYIKAYYTYQFYFDDQKSNKQVIDSKSGNCTDLLQMTINMALAMGYEYKVIHTQCRQSGTGHVYGKFRHKTNTNNQWIVRDVACIVDEKRSCVWCNVDTGAGYKLAENPSWFMQNLNR